jgi:hypothetical protein
MTRLKTVLPILFVLFVSSAPLLRAQTPELPPDPPTAEAVGDVAEERLVTFGLKGGLNVSWLRNDDDQMDERIGPLAGVFAAARFAGPIGAELDVLYSSSGYKSGSRSVALDYLQVPLLATVKLPKISKFHPMILTGPAASLRLRTRYGSAKTSTQTAFRDDVNRFEIGWVAGLALEVPIGESGGGFIIEGRCTFGLTPVFVDDSAYSVGKDRNRAYVGLAGFRF